MNISKATLFLVYVFYLLLSNCTAGFCDDSLKFNQDYTVQIVYDRYYFLDTSSLYLSPRPKLEIYNPVPTKSANYSEDSCYVFIDAYFYNDLVTVLLNDEVIYKHHVTSEQFTGYSDSRSFPIDKTKRQNIKIKINDGQYAVFSLKKGLNFIRINYSPIDSILEVIHTNRIQVYN